MLEKDARVGFLEATSFQAICTDQCEYAKDVRKFFSERMMLGDIEAIRQLVNLNCRTEFGDSRDPVTISSVLNGRPSEYINIALAKNQEEADEIFDEDADILQEKLSQARTPDIEVQPELKEATARVSQKLQAMATAMSKPLKGSYSVTNSFTADNERYYHHPGTDKLSQRLVKFNPIDGTITIMELPNVISMRRSVIC